MSFVPVTDVAKVELIMQLAGVEVVNIFHVHQMGGWDAATLHSLNLVFGTWLDVQYRQPLSSELTFTNVISTDIAVASGAQVNDPLVDAGADSGVSLPANAAIVMSWRTGYSGRSFRGRTYVPGVPAHTQIDPQTISETERAAIEDTGTALIAALTGASMELVVVSYFSGGAPRGTPIATPITTCLVNAQLDTQRRRLKQ